jgi:hypothetical protein
MGFPQIWSSETVLAEVDRRERGYIIGPEENGIEKNEDDQVAEISF